MWQDLNDFGPSFCRVWLEYLPFIQSYTPKGTLSFIHYSLILDAIGCYFDVRSELEYADKHTYREITLIYTSFNSYLQKTFILNVA